MSYLPSDDSSLELLSLSSESDVDEFNSMFPATGSNVGISFSVHLENAELVSGRDKQRVLLTLRRFPV